MPVKGRIGTYPVPADPWVDHLAAAVQRLRGKLLAVRSSDLSMSDYSRRYFEGTLVNGVSKLNLYAFLLFLAHHGKAPEQASLGGVVDYGGGNGLLALLAREAGIGTVVYTDIDGGSARDAAQLAAAVGLEADHYVVGDLADVTSYLRARAIRCEAICSYDVIEHVYDVDAFLRQLAVVTPGELRVILGSGANARNPRLRRRLMADQIRVENEDRTPDRGHKERDATRAYAQIRRSMIEELMPNLPTETINDLGKRTRGMARSDIEASVRRFAESGVLPPFPTHPTNTCDPNTGNWAEHLMDPNELAQTLAASGLGSQVLPGYYNPYVGWKGAVAAGLNLVIKTAGKHGLLLAPYYVVIGQRGSPSDPGQPPGSSAPGS